MGRAHWLILAGLLSVVSVRGAEPSGTDPRPDNTPRTLEEVDRFLKSMRETSWTLPESLGHPEPGPDGRTLDDDIAAYLMTDALIRALETQRGLLSKAAAADGTLPPSALREMDTLVQREICRVYSVVSYWSAGDNGRHAYRDSLIQTLLDRLPEVSDELATEVATVRKAQRMTRLMLEQDLGTCDALDPDQSGPEFSSSQTDARYDALRVRLAAEVDREVLAGRLHREVRERTESCPAVSTAKVPMQDRRVRVRRIPNLADFYPPEARRQIIEGEVRVALEYDRGGCVTKATVRSSSGSDALDEAALRVVLVTEMDPAIVDGKPQSGSATLPLRFRLRGESAGPGGQPQP